MVQTSKPNPHNQRSEDMTSLQDIQNYANKIAERFRPEKIILFGSQARGSSNPNSDVDLLVLMEYEGNSMRQAVKIRQEIRSSFPLDLVVRHPEGFIHDHAPTNYFLRNIRRDGIVLYDRGNH
jgi:predicted nucleotidyltransferase